MSVAVLDGNFFSFKIYSQQRSNMQYSITDYSHCAYNSYNLKGRCGRTCCFLKTILKNSTAKCYWCSVKFIVCERYETQLQENQAIYRAHYKMQSKVLTQNVKLSHYSLAEKHR